MITKFSEDQGKIIFMILSINEEDEISTCSMSNEYGLLPSDASIIVSMLNNSIKKILTDDSDFKKINFVKVIN